MTRHKIIRGLMTTAAALFFLSATAAGKVEVIGDGSQGTVDWKAEGTVITLTVTPSEGFFIRKSDITLTKTYMPSAAPRRAEVPIGDGLTLVGADPDDLTLPRTYTVTMPGEEYDLLVKLQFSNCQAIIESMVRLSETVFVYNEDVQRPMVFINGLTEGQDFTVTYDNPASTATGEYGITIKGRSTWTGTVRRTYKIFAGGKAEVNKSIAGGTIATAVDGLTVTLTVTPTDGYYIRKQDIAVAKTYMPVAAPRRSIPVADRLELTGDDPNDLSLPRTYTTQLPGWEYSVYVDATFTERQTITEGMVALSATSFVYNTSDQKPAISVTGLTEGKDYLVAFNGMSWTDVDTYKVTITGRSTWKGTINRTWSITKAPSEVTTVPKALSPIYTKTAQQLVSMGDAIGGTLVYGLDGTALQTVIPTGVDAGDYTVYYKVLGDANHFDSKVGSVPATIGKKAVVISGITAQDKVFDKTTAVTFLYDGTVYSGIVEGDMLSITAEGAFADTNAAVDKVVNITTLTLGGASIANYQLAEDGQQTEAKATIMPRSIQDAVISNIDNIDYTGQPLTPEVSVTLNGDTLNLGSDYTLGYADNVNAGNATITATGIGNYQDNIQKTFVINKVPSSVVTVPKALALDYTGQEQTLIVGGEASGGTMVYSTNGTTFDTSLPTATDEGLHKVYYKVQGDINHLDTEVDTLTCSITPKLVDNSGNEVDANFIEGENGNTEVVLNTLPEGFYEDPSKLSTTVSDENNNSYNVTQINAEAFDEKPNDILVVLPEGVSTTQGVTNVVNGDGTCETMDLTDVDNYNVPIDVAVDNVVYTRKVESNEPISVCLPYDADVPEGYNAYSMQLNTASELVMNLVTSNKMEAYQPYLLRSADTTPSSSPKRRTEGQEKVTLSAQNVTIKPSAVGSVTAGNFELRGTVSRMTHAEGVQLQAYILQPDQSWKMTASSGTEDADKTYLSAFQAYLLYHGEGELTEISIPLEGSGEVTAIIVIKNDRQQKRYYNLNGQHVSHPVKGIYIVDGKKVIVK